MGRLYDAYVEVGPRFAGFGDIKRQGDRAGREYGKALADAAAKAAAANVRRLGEALAKARDAEADAAGKVRVAEAKLEEIRKNSKTSASALAAAEEQLAAAQRKSSAASKLATDTAESLGKAQKQAAGAAEAAGKAGGNRFSNAWRGAMSKLGGEKEGKLVATRFGFGFNGAIGGIISRSAGVFAAGFAAVKGVEVFGGFIKDAAYSAQVARVSAQAIKSTGGAAKITAAQVGDLATAISNSTGADDEAIQSGENLLLTFTNIRNGVGKGNDIFNQAAAAITDMSAAMNDGQVTQEGLKTSAIQVGKALNDPLKGITALQKVGVTFTADQKKQIQTLVKSGKTMQAQKIILGELNKEFGGTAKAAGDPFTRLSTIFGNLGEQLGGYLLPYANKFATFVSDKLIPGVGGLADLLVKGDFTSGLREAFGVSEDSGFVSFLLKVHDAAATAFGFFKTDVLPQLKEFGGFIVGTVAPAIGRLAGNLISTFAPAVKDVFGFFKTDVLPRLKDFGSFLGDKVVPKVAAMASALSKNKDFLVPFATTILAVVGAVKAWTIAQAALDVVLAANPLGLLVIGLAAVVGGLVYAYKHSETFRDVVNKVFTAVKDTAVGAFNIIKGGIGAVVTAFTATKNVIGTAIGAVGTAFGAVKSAIGTAVSAVSGAVSAVVGAVKSAFGAAVGFVKSVWGGIVAAVSGPVAGVIGFLQAVWSRISPILQLPFYIALRTIQGVWKSIVIAFTAAKNWVTGAFAKAWAAVGPIIMLPVRGAQIAIGTIWNGIKIAFNAAKGWVTGAFAKAWATVKTVVSVPVSGAKILLDGIWSGIRTAFNATKNYVTGAFSRAWAGVKSIITTPISLAKNAVATILGAGKGGLRWVFSTAVSSISAIWSKLQGLAKAPIKFIVNTVLNNGLIAGFNWIANKFQAPTIKPIPLPKGFASGGYFSGRLPGPPSAVDNLMGYAKGGQMFGLAGGEFVVNAKQTQKHLPTLMAMNAGLDGYADGGIIGGLKKAITAGLNAVNPLGGVMNVLDAATNKFLGNPVDWLKNRFAAPLKALDQISGSAVGQIVTSVPRKIAVTIEDKAKSLVGLGGSGDGGFNPGLNGALAFARAQIGKPYIWGGVGPAGYDCSGFLSALVNVARGRNPYSRLFATGSMPGGIFERGPGAFEVAWFRGNPGHTAGTINGVNVESRGGRGPGVGPGSRGARDPLFNSGVWHLPGFAEGGFVGDPPYDGFAGWRTRQNAAIRHALHLRHSAHLQHLQHAAHTAHAKHEPNWSTMLPAFASGSWEIPQDLIAKVHKGEMVIPAKPAGVLRSFTSPVRRLRSRLHQLHLQHEAHQAHAAHLGHLAAVGRSGYLGPIGRGAVGGDISVSTGGTTVRLHRDDVRAIAEAVASSPILLDGKRVDAAMSSSAISRGYR